MKTAYYNLMHRGSTWGAFFNFAVVAKDDGCTEIVIIAGHRGELQRYPVEVSKRRALTMMIPLANLLGMTARYEPQPSGLTSKYPNTGKGLIGRTVEFIDTEESAFAGYITITIREQSFQTIRNSNIGEWIRAAHQMKRDGFDVVFVPDFEHQEREFDGFPIHCQAAADLRERLALYRSALVNFFVPNGPSILVQYSPIPAIMLRPLVGEGSQLIPRFWKKEFGIEPGEQPVWWGPERLLWWADDTRGTIWNAFKVWCVKNQERVMPRECRMMNRRWERVMHASVS